MGFASFLGVILAMTALPFMFIRWSGSKVCFAILLLVMHVVFAIVYWWYTQSFGGDAQVYYNDQLRWASAPMAAGSSFTVHFTQFLKNILFATYLDCFLIFQAFGFWGIAIVVRVFEELSDEYDIQTLNAAFLFLLMPGLHFWTVAIGKDAPLFLGSALAVWAMMNFHRRFWYFGFAIVLIYAFRPHVALLGLGSALFVNLLDRKISPVLKGALTVSSLFVLPTMVAYVQTYASVSSFSIDGIADFLETRSEIADYIEGGSDLTSLSFPEKVLTFLFRPFFFDAQGLLGLVASLENTVWLGIFGYMIFRWRDLTGLFFSDSGARYSLIFSIGLIVVLASVNYNVGLGLRQKMMVMPAILYLFYLVMARRTQAAPVHKPSWAVSAE